MTIKVIKDGETIHTIETTMDGYKANSIYALALFLLTIPQDQRDAALVLMLGSASSNPEDLAEAMGCKPSTIAKRLTHARALFRGIVKAGEAEARKDILFIPDEGEDEKQSKEKEWWDAFFAGDFEKLPTLWGMGERKTRRMTRHY